MRVEQLGDGTPEVAVVGAVHGDEPCGARAVERLLAESPAVERPVKLVVANETALREGVRYVDEDLNRAFPGDPGGSTHESRLAGRLTEELDGCVTLSLHSTQSQAEPFAIVSGVDDLARKVVPRLSVVAAVDAADNVEGRLFATSGVIEVECGRQGTREATENAYRLTREFLAATGAMAGEAVDPQPVALYRLTEQLPKDEEADEYEVLAENFTLVEAGQAYAAADGERLAAENAFYPVLLSARGYVDIFGYAAEHVGSVR